MHETKEKQSTEHVKGSSVKKWHRVQTAERVVVKYLDRTARAPTATITQWCRRCQTRRPRIRRCKLPQSGAERAGKTRQFSRVSRERENRAHRCPQPKEGEKSHEQSVRRVIWLRESNKRIEKLHREVAYWSRLQWETAVWSFREREREKQTEVDRVCANQVQDRPQDCLSWKEIVWVSASEWEQAQDDCGERLRTFRACLAPSSFRKKQTSCKSEINADSKTNQKNLTNAETEMVCVVTKTFGEKTVRQKSLAIDVEEMVSELSEAEKSWILPCRQSIKSDRGSESEKWWTVPNKWWRYHDWDNVKFLNDVNNLELFNEAV